MSVSHQPFPEPKMASGGIKIIKVNKVPSDGSASRDERRGRRLVCPRLPLGALAAAAL